MCDACGAITTLEYQSVTLLLHPPHAVVMRLQGRGASNIVILAPEMAVLLGVCSEAGLIGRALPRMHFIAES